MNFGMQIRILPIESFVKIYSNKAILVFFISMMLRTIIKSKIPLVGHVFFLFVCLHYSSNCTEAATLGRQVGNVRELQ